jgi:aromatic ring-opening dioxygenase catalytic subunit (LigB family)
MKDIVSEIIERLKGADKELTQVLASGVNIHTFDTYQRFVGQREGVQDALAIINEILNEENNEDS